MSESRNSGTPSPVPRRDSLSSFSHSSSGGNYPVLHRTSDSPRELLHKRYQLNESLDETTRIVFGIDKKARNPQARRILIFVFDDEEEYDRRVELHKKLRSKYIANMLDYWTEPELGRSFVVVERGGATLEEYSCEVELSIEQRKTVLTHISLCWLHIYNQNYYLQFNMSDFMQYGKDWKLFNLCSAGEGRSSPLNAIYCDQELATAIMEGKQSVFLPGEEQEFEHILGSVLLELLLLNPLFSDKTIEDVYQIMAIEDLVDRVSELKEEEVEVVRLVQQILINPQEHGEEKVEKLIHAITAILHTAPEVQQRPGATTSSTTVQKPKTAGYLPSIV